MDDTFLIIPSNKIKDTIENFNSYHSRLKFTFELEIDNTLPFLNLLIIKNQDGTLVTNWFRKNTFSGRYLNFYSNHPFQQKNAIIKNLVDTAKLLSHEKFYEENLKIINNLLVTGLCQQTTNFRRPQRQHPTRNCQRSGRNVCQSGGKLPENKISDKCNAQINVL